MNILRYWCMFYVLQKSVWYVEFNFNRDYKYLIFL